MERSDHLNDEDPKGPAQVPQQAWSYEEWQNRNPCPRNRANCKSCLIDYTTYLAHKAIGVVSDG